MSKESKTYWEILPDHAYDICPDVLVHEVKCPICHNHETYTGDNPPNMCYVCEEERIMPKV